jgi:hypothetical protein
VYGICLKKLSANSAVNSLLELFACIEGVCWFFFFFFCHCSVAGLWFSSTVG